MLTLFSASAAGILIVLCVTPISSRAGTETPGSVAGESATGRLVERGVALDRPEPGLDAADCDLKAAIAPSRPFGAASPDELALVASVTKLADAALKEAGA